jgi:NTE family protein
MTRPRIGLALGSGSAREWSHIGIISSLIEAGIEPDIICGTSIGSFVGAAYVAGRLDGAAAVGGGCDLARDRRTDGMSG